MVRARIRRISKKMSAPNDSSSIMSLAVAAGVSIETPSPPPSLRLKVAEEFAKW
jgi:hypothetical protein